MRHALPTLAALLAATLAAPARAQQPSAGSTAPAAAAAPGLLLGRVVDDARCTPVRGAAVRVAGVPPMVTGADGRFRFPALASGSHTVSVQRTAYAPAERPVQVAPAGLGYAELRLRAADAAPADGGAGRRTTGATADAAPRVSAVGGRPRQGSLFRLRALLPSSWPGDSAPAGELAGQRLHFVRTAPRTFEALAPVPVDAPDTLVATVAGHPAPIAIARGDFPVERLRVAPEFGREPDLALAERLERESERARDVGCQAQLTPRLWRAPFTRPRPGRITSGFGRAREYNGTVTSRHTGTDFAGAVGAPVRATNRGVVRLVDRFYLGGNVVYVDHGAGVVSAYLHLSRTDVAAGDTVARGQVLGGVGSTGRVTGPHLHWVVRYGTVSVDPMSLLAVAGAPDAR